MTVFAQPALTHRRRPKVVPLLSITAPSHWNLDQGSIDGFKEDSFDDLTLALLWMDNLGPGSRGPLAYNNR